ncbi:MAG: rRNA pseudouridine synthase [Clostridiales bacterium]|nr:rRNA pseudouridine synthase [Clostridiales bacterium]
MRLDKYLANMGVGSRSEVKNYIRWHKVLVNGKPPKGPEQKIDEEKDVIVFAGTEIGYQKNYYIMLHKPAGVITATEDKKDKTVLDFIDLPIKKQLFPVGRLDKDTEGLLILTNDGQLSHNLLSPKKHVSKVYYAKIEGKVTIEDVEKFREGLQIEEDFTALPAELTIVKEDEISEVKIKIYEGKFHQVKRMFEAVGKKVLYLKRLSMGGLALDENLAAGEYRELTEEEVLLLQEKGNSSTRG